VARVKIRFYAELGDFLPPDRRQVDFGHGIRNEESVGDIIETLGVPHTEVELIMVNGRSVDFSHRVEEGDRVSVFPVFESLDITPLLRVRTRPLRETRFVLDTDLRGLARHLRALGFDTLYREDCDVEALVRLSAEERRILLTRDKALVERDAVTHGYCVRESDPRRQLDEILRRFDLSGGLRPPESPRPTASGSRG